MRRTLLLCASATVAAVPAVFGLTGNPSVSQTVPVTAAPQVRAAAATRPTPLATRVADDHGRHETGDDRAGVASRPASPSRAQAPTAVAGVGRLGDKGTRAEPGDDRVISSAPTTHPVAPSAPARVDDHPGAGSGRAADSSEPRGSDSGRTRSGGHDDALAHQ
jgi:hypothetical protein